MCLSSAPIVSEFIEITSLTATSIEGNDILAGGTVTLCFWDPPTVVCLGEEIGGDHYYDLPMSHYDQVLTCIAGRKKIQVKARYIGDHDYIRVAWKAVSR